MRQRHLGSDELTCSAVGLGCMGLSQAYGPADDDESIATIRHALDVGVNLLDTAMSYGAGHNEQLIGRAVVGRREQVVLASKFGIVRDEHGVRVDGRTEHVRGYCEASLRRLGVDTIDLYYLHRVDPHVPVADTVGAMAELVTEGKVGHLGLSEANPVQLEQAAAVHPITALQMEWSLFWREPEDDVIPAARRLGIALVPYSPLGRGLLTGALPAGGFGAYDFRSRDPRFSGDALTATSPSSRPSGRWRPNVASRPGNSHWPGCSRRDPTSCPFPEPAVSNGWTRTPPRPSSSCRPPTATASTRSPRAEPGSGTAIPSPRTASTAMSSSSPVPRCG